MESVIKLLINMSMKQKSSITCAFSIHGCYLYFYFDFDLMLSIIFEHTKQEVKDEATYLTYVLIII